MGQFVYQDVLLLPWFGMIEEEVGVPTAEENTAGRSDFTFG